MNTKQLLNWYKENARDLPWRKTTDPYLIWVSEIILQQTRVVQGIDYYHKFIEKFPSLHKLAAANEQEVLKAWEGLGYYSRARNLHFTAKDLINNYQGKFPSDYIGLLRLKGIGPYTAAAIASFAFGQKVPAIDGNVMRFLSRYYGLENNIASSSEVKIFRQKAEKIIDPDNPGLFNQAMMEFGAMQCTPSSPDCGKCIFQQQCIAYQTGKVNQLPVKIKIQKIRSRHLHFFLIYCEGEFLIEKRTEKGIWKNLYQLPLIETNSKNLKEEEMKEFLRKYNLKTGKNAKKINSLTHLLSHQKLHINFWILNTCTSTGFFIEPKDIERYPFPIVIAKFLDNYFN